MVKRKFCNWCGQDNDENINECEYCGENLIIEGNCDVIDVKDENEIPSIIEMRKFQKLKNENI